MPDWLPGLLLVLLCLGVTAFVTLGGKDQNY